MSAVEPPSSSAAAAPVPAVAPSSDAAGHTSDSDEQLLQSSPAHQQRGVAAGNGHKATVTLASPPEGKQLTSWVWRVMSRFSPTINRKNVVCLGKVANKGVLTPCNHMMTRKSEAGGQPRTGTSELVNHFEKKQPGEHQAILADVGLAQDGKIGQ